MANIDRQRTTFHQVLEALLDETHPFPPMFLHRFSDLDPKNLKALKDIWDQIPVTRRRSLLEDLEETAEVDTLVSFEEVGRHALNDPDAQVRTTAIRLLWEVEVRHLVPVFIKMLNSDPDSQVRAAAASALGLFIYLGEIEEIPEETLKAVENELIRVVQSEELPLVRRRALEALGFSSREEVPVLIQDAYEQGNQDWLATALYAMGRSADNRWSDPVLKMFTHVEASVREEAVRAAGELELVAARDRLIDLLPEEPDEDVQMAAVWSLSQIGGEGVRGLLERLLEESDDDEIADFIENALDNLTFTEDMQGFDMIDIDADLDEEDAPPKPADTPPQPSQKKRGSRKTGK
ncbi:MAG TPA: HEAT repeat domain-containing protein [Anaerolineaceae bacterium]